MTEKNGKRKKEKGEETERRTALKEKRKQKTFKLCLPTLFRGNIMSVSRFLFDGRVGLTCDYKLRNQ